MDDLDVRIFRALSSERAVAPFSTRVKASMREIGRVLGVDDATVYSRLRRFREKGLLSGWMLLPNPGLFGYRMMAVVVDLPAKSPKSDLIRKLKLVERIVVLMEFYGDALGVILLYDTERSLARTIELISRIAGVEDITKIQILFPRPEAKRLTETDWAIIGNMSNDALKHHAAVARELGYSARTVKYRLEKLQRERAVMITADVNISAVDGMASAILFYSYASSAEKEAVDRAMLSHFDGIYLWARLTDSAHGYLVIAAQNMKVIKNSLNWAREQPGVASARIEVVTDVIDLWDNAIELFKRPAQFAASAVEV